MHYLFIGNGKSNKSLLHNKKKQTQPLMTETATQRNGHWLEQKAKVKELLSSEEYKTLMKKLELNVKLSLVRQKAI